MLSKRSSFNATLFRKNLTRFWPLWGGASLLGKPFIGSLEEGMCADLFLIDSRRLELVGAALDPKNVLATVGVRGPVDYTVVHGRVTVRQGHLAAMDEMELAQRANRACMAYLNR